MIGLLKDAALDGLYAAVAVGSFLFFFIPVLTLLGMVIGAAKYFSKPKRKGNY